MRLISADELMELYGGCDGLSVPIAVVQQNIKDTTTIDAEPVRHGRWETEMDDMGWLKHTCPICGYVKRTDIHISLGWHYCPNCGAKMDGELNE